MKLILIILLASAGSAVAQTNVVSPDRVAAGFDTVRAWLEGALALLLVLSTWYANNRSKIATLVGPLMRNVEKHGSKELKLAIKNEAGELGIEPTMNAQKLVNVPTMDKPVVPTEPIRP